MPRLVFIFALTPIACDSDVSVVDGGGASSTNANGGHGASGGLSGSGASSGSGGGGGVEPAPVPGCELLIPNGAPYMLPANLDASEGAIGTLTSNEILLVFQTTYGQGAGLWRVVSHRVLDPFVTWPPVISAGTEHHIGLFNGGVMTTRSDGAFLVDGYTDAFGGKWGVPGPFFEAQFGWPSAHLEPSGQGYYQSEDDELRHFATLTDPVPSATLTLPGPVQVSGSDSNGRLVLSSEGWLYTVEGANVTPLTDVPEDLYRPAILPRAAGGFWFAGKSETGVDVWSVETSGSQLIQPLGNAEVYLVAFGLWKDTGVVVAATAQSVGGYHVAITDGLNVTKVTLSAAEAHNSQNVLSVAASPDGASILVGYLGGSSGEYGFAIQRFDCSSP